ncbi:MAG TPA: sugar transferase [Chloroflexota bacterium]|nr:sugar transferase [Chloroflexota bacterium]
MSINLGAPVAASPGLRLVGPNRSVARSATNTKWRQRVALVLADTVLIGLGFMLAYWLRYDLRLWPESGEFVDAPFSAYYLALVLLLVVSVASYSQRGLYRLRRATQWLDEVGMIIAGTTLAVSILVMVFFLFRPGITSRAMLFYAWIAIIGLLSLMRLAIRWVVASRRRRGIGLARVLVIGAGHMGKMVMQQIAGHPGLGYRLVGFCDDVSWAQRAAFGRFRCLGSVDSLSNVVDEHRVDEVVIALPSVHHEKILGIVSLCRQRNVEFRLVPDTFDLTLGTLEVDDIAGIPLIGLRETALHGLNLWVKRAIDIVVSASALVVAAPVMFLVALAVKLDSAGPVFIPQERVGTGGRVFRIHKVRSMYIDAAQRLRELRQLNEAGGPIFKMRNDPRRTRVGRIIRRLSLDEVPQLWNVLVGDMSLVGPRPPIPREVEEYDEWHKRRLEVTPGLTGLWQVSGRSDLPFDEMVMLDLYYIENWSLTLDLKIILQTFPAVLSMRGAY